MPETVEAAVNDEHSGPAGGEIEYRRLGSDNWMEMATKSGGRGEPVRRRSSLVCRMLAPGTYVFRADAVDGAGNTATTTRRADGTEMSLRKDPPRRIGAGRAPPHRPADAGKTRLFARLSWRHGLGNRADGAVRPPGRFSAVDSPTPAAPGSGAVRCGSSARPSRGALAPSPGF